MLSRATPIQVKTNKSSASPSDVMAFPALSFDLAVCSSEAMVAEDHSSLQMTF